MKETRIHDYNNSISDHRPTSVTLHFPRNAPSQNLTELPRSRLDFESCCEALDKLWNRIEPTSCENLEDLVLDAINNNINISKKRNENKSKDWFTEELSEGFEAGFWWATAASRRSASRVFIRAS